QLILKANQANFSTNVLYSVSSPRETAAGVGRPSGKSRLSRPYPNKSSFPTSPKSFAVPLSTCLISSFVHLPSPFTRPVLLHAFSSLPSKSAIAPVTNGVAIEVPLESRYLPPIAVDLIPEPGATSSTWLPVRENDDKVLSLFTEP